MSRSRSRILILALALACMAAALTASSSFALSKVHGLKLVPAPTAMRPTAFTLTMNGVAFVVEHQESVYCETATAQGEFTDAEDGKGTFRFHGCSITGSPTYACTSSGALKGELVSASVPLALTHTPGSEYRIVANQQYSETLGEHPTLFVPAFKCAGATAGPIVGEPELNVSPLNTKGKVFTAKLTKGNYYNNTEESLQLGRLSWTNTLGESWGLTPSSSSGTLTLLTESEFKTY